MPCLTVRMHFYKGVPLAVHILDHILLDIEGMPVQPVLHVSEQCDNV
jgi:hypothetical protein